MDDPAGLDALLAAIKHNHGLEAEWIETVPVREEWQGAVIWDGSVEVFTVGHPQTARAYAWSHATTGTRRRFFTVLGIGPIVDARAAVRAAIVASES